MTEKQTTTTIAEQIESELDCLEADIIELIEDRYPKDEIEKIRGKISEAFKQFFRCIRFLLEREQ